MVVWPHVLGKNIMALGACTREYFLMADRKQKTGQAGTRLAFSPPSLCYVWTSDPWDEAALSQGVSPTQLILSGSPIIDIPRCASLISKVILNANDSKE